MKKLYLLGILALFLSTILCVSCSDDDKVDISHLAGNKWKVVYANPSFTDCNWKEYHFNEDKTCSVFSYTELADGKVNVKVAYVDYVISIDEKILTLKTEEKYTEQYRFLGLKSEYMSWENTTKGDGNPDYVELKRVTE